MKKVFVVVAAVLAFWAGASSLLAAQEPVAAIVNVPFRFIAADRVLPAGSYRLEPQTADWSVVKLTNIDGKAIVSAVFVVTNGLAVTQASTDDARLKFVIYGGQHFLQELSVPGRDSRQLVVTPSTAQRTLVKLNLMTAEPADVAK